MDNPDSAKMLAFLHRQRNHLQERQPLKAVSRQGGERIMRISDRARERSDSSSDDAAAASDQAARAARMSAALGSALTAAVMGSPAAIKSRDQQ